MMNNLLKLLVIGSLFIGTTNAENKQSAAEAITRFEGIKKILAEKGGEAIAFLNGIEPGGSVSGKGKDEIIELESTIDNQQDPNAHLICVGIDNKYIVHTGNHSLIGKDAVTGSDAWNDGSGKSVVEKYRNALKNSTGLTNIDDSGKNLELADGRFLGAGLPEGAFCATHATKQPVVINPSSVDHPEKHAANHHHHHHKDHHKHASDHKNTEAAKIEDKAKDMAIIPSATNTEKK